MNLGTTNKDQVPYEEYIGELQSLEAEVSAQLDMLSAEIPEIYKGYAEIVKQTLDSAISVLELSEKTLNKIFLAAEIGTRTIQAFGAWKAAREHNRMLERFLVTKKKIAEANLAKVEKGLQRAERTLRTHERLFETHANQRYNLIGENDLKIGRISEVELKVLMMYRTSLFLNMMFEYLTCEYLAWNEGKQTSGETRPDPFITNEEIVKKLFGKNVFDALDRASESNGIFTGGQIMVLSDPQLAVFSLKDTLCRIKIDQASEPVQTLLKNNPGIKYYADKSTPLIEKIEDAERNVFSIYAVLAFIAVICLCIWYVPGETWERVVVGLLSTVAIWRVSNRTNREATKIYVVENLEMMEKVDDDIESYCGKVNLPEIDLAKKDNFTEAARAFFNF